MSTTREHRDPGRPGSGGTGSVAGFCARFTILVLALFVPLFVLAEDAAAPLSRLIASIVTGTLNAVHIRAEQAGTMLTVGDFRGAVAQQCTGLFEIALLVAAIWAWRAPVRARVLGTLFGVAFLFVVNLVRVASLMLIGAHAPGWFTEAHLYVWQGLLVATVGGAWLVWARRLPSLD